MNPKKVPRILTVLIAGVLVSTALIYPQQLNAAEGSVSAQTYVTDTEFLPHNDGRRADFFDVKPSDWFYADVMRLADEDILTGYYDGGFYPERQVTTAEFIKLVVAGVLDIDRFTVDEVLFEGHWASKYIGLAYKLGFITDEDLASGFSPDDPIKRSDTAKFAARALGIYSDGGAENPFLDYADGYAVSAYREYLVRGYPAENGSRLFRGDSNVCRSEAAAIVVRVVDYAKDPYAYKRDAILKNAAEFPLRYEWELIDLFYVLNRELVTEFTFTTPYSYAEWSGIYRRANVMHLEYFYSSYLNCSYKRNSNVYSLVLEYEADTDTLRAYRDEVEEKADGIVDSIIKGDMDDAQKIKAIHDYIVLNCKYDYDNYTRGSVGIESRLAYGVMCRRSAVCQGYAAAFNILARRAGIHSETVTGTAPGNADVHAWNRVTVDGEVYHIDTTHDDPVPDRQGYVSYKYFMRTDREMTEMGYVWEKNEV